MHSLARLGKRVGILALILAGPAVSAANLPALGYSENFDSMGAAGTAPPSSWTTGNLTGAVNRSVDGNGAIILKTLTVDNGSNATVGLNFNLGDPGAGERALGAAPNTASGDAVHQLELTNATGAPLNAITLSYRGEQWRQAQATSSSGPEQFRLFYSTSPDSGFVSMGSGFDFVAPQNTPNAATALNGNAAANSATILGTFTLPAAVANGGNLYLRWLDWNDNGTTDHQLGIDNVVVTPVGVPEPGTAALAAIASLGLLARRRARA